MDDLQTLHLFADERWQRCLESFLDDISQDLSHSMLVDCRTTLRLFFQGRKTEAIDHESIEAYCRKATIYKRPPCEGTVKRRRKVLRLFYDYASARGIYAGPNPACLPVEERRTVHNLFSDPHWQQCFDSFLQELQHRSGSAATVANYSQTLCRFFSDPQRDPQLVTRADVSQFVNADTSTRGAKSHAPKIATVNVRIAHLRSFYNHASSWTVIQDGQLEALFNHANPCLGLKFGKPAIAYKSLSPSEISAFFAAIDRSTLAGLRDYSLYMFFLMSARRRSAIQRLKFGDLEKGLISDEHGNVHEGYVYRFTEKGTSTIQDSEEIEPAVVNLIMEYLEADNRLTTATPGMPIWRAIGPEIGGNVRPGEMRPLSAKSMADGMKRIAVKAGLDPKRMSLHSWRHSSAKMRRLAGSSVLDISRVLRHSSLDMSMRYIGKLVSQSDDGGRLLSSELSRLGVL